MSRSEVVLLLRLSTLVLVLTSVVMLVVASQYTWTTLDGAVIDDTYTPFLFLAGFDIAAAMMEAAAILLHLRKGGGDRDGIVVMLIDGAVDALLFASTVVTFTVGCIFRRQVSAWFGSGGQACRSRLGLSMAAGIAVGLAAVVKQYVYSFRRREMLP